MSTSHSSRTRAPFAEALQLAAGRHTVLVQGSDFYAAPRLSPDGSKLLWLAWDHPNMPWNGTTLYLADLDARYPATPAGLGVTVAWGLPPCPP